MLLITSFAFSKLFYCSSVWGNIVKSNINKLQLARNFAARIVFAHISVGRRSLKWLNVYEKILFNDLVLVFECLNGLTPSYLFHYFTTRSAIHSRNTRRSGDLSLPRYQLSAGQRGFYFRGVNGGVTCQRTFSTLKTSRFLRKDYLIVRNVFGKSLLTQWLYFYDLLYIILNVT